MTVMVVVIYVTQESMLTDNSYLGEHRESVRRVIWNGFMLSVASATIGNSFVFLKTQIGNHPPQQVYQIQRIEKIKGAQCELTIKRLLENTTVEDRYSSYRLLRAKVWARQLETDTHVVLLRDIRSHAAIWNFSDTHCVAVVLDRVSVQATYLLASDRPTISGHMEMTLLKLGCFRRNERF